MRSSQFQLDRVSNNGSRETQLPGRRLCLYDQVGVSSQLLGADTVPCQRGKALTPGQLHVRIELYPVHTRLEWCQCQRLSTGVCSQQDILHRFFQTLEPPHPHVDVQVDRAEFANVERLIQGLGNTCFSCSVAVSADSALALGEALKTGPEFWLNLQRDWDLWYAIDSHRKVPPLKKVG